MSWILAFTSLAAVLPIAAAGCSCGSEETEEDAPEEDADAPDDQGTDLPGDDGTGDPAPDQDVAPDEGPPDTPGEDGPPPDAPPDEGGAEDPADEEELPPAIEGCIAGTFQPYWGNLHAHTSNSDGEGTPEQAFAWARDMAGLDILVVTDHLEYLILGDRWAGCGAQADAAYDPAGGFLAMCGFEYGTGRYLLVWSTGHANVFFSDTLFPELQIDFRDFYRSLVDCPLCIGQYNHPGDSEYEHWNHYEYYADVDERMNLFEFNSGGPVWDLFFEALDAGWSISPMFNQDNHGDDWGTKNDNRSGFFMADLTREAMRDAMLGRRSFATTDKNAWVKMTAEGTCWMGSMLRGVASVSLEVEAVDADAGDTFTNVEIFGPGQTLIDTLACDGTETCAVSFTSTASPGLYLVARAHQTDGNWLISAPVWLEP